ncbi:LuxR family transcriptional regulator [Glacieibacterium megasporae]|uniref:LuxR family transcriptional regulator n=1 Tax=Glacieibacterium megasporae TaxID=2835787 RepID=UPI001CAA6358|nr:LuxR family transcriptional regulator [Polymorphobacter megasporae]UAJ12762.1 LuxR family transcriptional regulator [Polymorphobacter megasporae]
MTASASGMVSGPRVLGPNQFHFTNWPAAWLALYQARGFAKFDPLPRWAIISGEAVAWSEIMARLEPSDPGFQVYAAAGVHGFFEGFATPVRGRTGALGLVAVAGGRRAEFNADERAYLQSISIAALHRGEELLGVPKPLVGTFTPREHECVALLRQGFTDPEIGRVIGISPTTVKFHLDNARRKTGTRNRVELAVGAHAFPVQGLVDAALK